MGMTRWKAARQPANPGGRLGFRAGVNSQRELPTTIRAGWHVSRSAQGWMILRRPFQAIEGVEPLTLHADWPGPVKLVTWPGGVEQRIELFLAPSLGFEADFLLDEDASLARQQETKELLERFAQLAEERCVQAWEPPPAERCAEWLQQAGCQTAIDQDQHLRFTLKRRGCDGQVRVERSPGRLRFVLALGRWEELSEASRRAIARLASLFNARSRLVRVAWITEDDSRRCEAQVDLTGLPAPIDGDAFAQPAQSLWREMVRLAVGGMELALRQLGLELPLLADPAHADLAEAMTNVE
jgi:cell division inhibitor SulA